MPLFNTLRQNNKVFLTEFYGSNQYSASMLLRTVALYALTYTQCQYSKNIIKYPTRPQELDALPEYDAWFPCPSNNIGAKFIFNGRQTTFEDKIIKLNEVSHDYIPPTNDPIKDRYFVPNVPVEINDGNNAATVNDINTAISFFDEVNSIHNWHTSQARGINDSGTLPQFINVSSNDRRSIYMTVQKTGNCEGTIVQNWGAYKNDDDEGDKKFKGKIDFATQVDTFKKLKIHFKNRTAINSTRVANLRDLYRLECIREPAALLTNAMFLDLATVGNYGYNILDMTIDFDNITKSMPMAPKKTVEQCRILWSDLIQVSNDKIIPIYYRYDYNVVKKTFSIDNNNPLSYSLLATLENNLLFCYLIYKADQLNENADIKETINDIYLNNEYQGVTLYDNTEQELTFLIKINNLTYEIKISFGPKDDDGDRTISVTSFPLILLKILLYEWYYVVLDLPDIQIEGINLSPQ